MNKFYVYGHFDSEGVCRYIGKGKANRAWSFTQRSKAWHKTFPKGPARVEILFDNMTEQDAFEKEIQLISERKVYLCNIADGGMGGFTGNYHSGKDHYNYGKSMPEETKAKIRETKATREGAVAKPWLGKKRDPEFMKKLTESSMTPEAIEKRASKLRGRKASPETKAKLSEARKGRVHSEETKAKISAANKGGPGTPGERSDEFKAKMSAIMKERMAEGSKLREALKNRKKGWTTSKAKAVICIELDKAFRTAKDAAEELGCNDKHIQACCVGRRKTHGGYTWKYATT